MEVILLQDVKALGKKGEIVSVNEGYAKNFLLKKKFAVVADNKNKNDLKLQNANNEKIAKEKLENAKEMAKKIEDSVVNLKIKVGSNGRVFGSVSSKEIAAAAKDIGLDIDKKKIHMDDHIKSVGTHKVKIKLHPEVSAMLTVKVEGME
ncbi:large subunit ribosomal protein L9 [Lachnospiraceae bacterium RM5]|nr:large subunit ribosomal protein L9 [Lachnospiraceae bacterium RM5]